MATTTTNFGFDVPTSSDLVKNGATAISTLGQDIDTFLAGSPTSTAGKNKIINGDFLIWQRGTTFNSIASSTYAADRWVFGTIGDVVNVSRQSFTPNEIVAIGYGSAKYYSRMEVVSSNGSARMTQRIENVETLANQDVKVSFWAKANAAVSLDVYIQQNFGSGGSATPAETTQAVSLTTSWQRFSLTFTVPSITGKTVGTSSYLELGLRETVASTNKIFDFWGVQVEAGSTLTNFQTASGGSQQAELAMCQRYLPAIAASNGEIYTGQCYSSTAALIPVVFPVTARVAPTGITVNSAGNFRVRSSTASKLTTTAINFSTGTVQGACIEAVVASGLTAGNATNLFNESSGTILFTGCEL